MLLKLYIFSISFIIEIHESFLICASLNMPPVTRGPWEYLCSYLCQHRVSCRGIPLASSVEKAHALWTLHMDFSTAGRLLTDIDLSSFHQPQDTSLLSFFAFSYLLVIWFHICFSHISGHHATAPMRFDVLSGSVVFHHLSGEASTVLPLLRGCLSKHQEIVHKCITALNHPLRSFSVCNDIFKVPQPNEELLDIN